MEAYNFFSYERYTKLVVACEMNIFYSILAYSTYYFCQKKNLLFNKIANKKYYLIGQNQRISTSRPLVKKSTSRPQLYSIKRPKEIEFRISSTY